MSNCLIRNENGRLSSFEQFIDAGCLGFRIHQQMHVLRQEDKGDRSIVCRMVARSIDWQSIVHQRLLVNGG